MPTRPKVRTMSRKPNPAVTAAAIEADPRWALLKARSSEADGTFFYSVATTGIVCRPACPSRHPKPENVRFHATLDEAVRLGFRPCKRCKPDAPSHTAQLTDKIARACRLIERAETPPTLAELAEAAGLSTFHFHRQFKAVTGVTPKAYAETHRGNRLRAALGTSRRVTDAIYDAGFNAPSRFYEKANKLLGMSATDYRYAANATRQSPGDSGRTPKAVPKGLKDRPQRALSNIRFAIGQCSLGAILVAQSDKGICAILIDDDPEALVQDLQRRFPRAHLIGGDKAFEKLVAQVVGFVEAPKPAFDLPLDIRGTAFQQKVWKALTRIPPGRTLSYSELAQKIGEPAAVRAVASACAANKIAVAIPCHRVVRQDGGLSGYRWGVERKAALLKKEAKA